MRMGPAERFIDDADLTAESASWSECRVARSTPRTLGTAFRWLHAALGRHDMPMGSETDTVTLWRPTGPAELALVEASGWRQWPPRLPDQPIFYPVLNEEYATMIALRFTRSAAGPSWNTGSLLST